MWNDADLTERQGTGLSSPHFRSQQVRDLQDKLLQYFLVDPCQSCILCWDLSWAAPMQTLQETRIWELSISCSQQFQLLTEPELLYPAHLCLARKWPEPFLRACWHWNCSVSLPWSLWRSCRRGRAGGWPGSRPGPCGPSRRSSAPARWPSPPSRPARDREQHRAQATLSPTPASPQNPGEWCSSLISPMEMQHSVRRSPSLDPSAAAGW